MLPRTRSLWEKQDQHPGDRQRLFEAVAEAVSVGRALYPGSFVDVAASFVWPDVAEPITKARLHESGRGVAYTKSPFACLFERVA